MTTRTRSLLDLLLALILFALLAGIYLAASHAIESQVKAAVDAVQERQHSNEESMMRVNSNRG
jgi:type II secretory pathway component PulJ